MTLCGIHHEDIPSDSYHQLQAPVTTSKQETSKIFDYLVLRYPILYETLIQDKTLTNTHTVDFIKDLYK